MSLPKQVQLQAEEAARLEKELEAAANPQPTPDPTPPTDPTPTVDPKGSQDPIEPAPAPAPVVDPTPTVDWEHKYKTLQGMFNAETARRDTQIKELSGQLQGALTKIDELGKAPQPAAEPTAKLVTDKDVEAFGDDLIDLVKRQAQEVIAEKEREMQSVVKKLEAENAELREKLGGVAERQGVDARKGYIAELAKAVPDWEVLNVDEGFMGWLAEIDPLSGFPRQLYLNDAFEKFDVARTAALFNTYKELNGRNTPPPAPTPKQPDPQLQRQLQPSKVQAAQPVTEDPANRVWAMSEIDTFYRDVARGEFRGRDADRARIESEIDLAVAQGRLKP